jgi:2-dehydropantoate 2-reductase
MRYVILGAGAIGGAIGGRLVIAGRDVTFIARGQHLEVLREQGLELRDPDGSECFQVEAVASPSEAKLQEGDCVILATKSQQTEGAIESLRTATSQAGVRHVGVVCAQNGVANENMVLRRFEQVYGMRVILAGTHLEPGIVEIATAPVFGVLDVGCYPAGVDGRAEELAADLQASGFDARACAEVMALKYLKLLGNLGNALDAACRTEDGNEAARAVLAAARREARECFDKAGIALADEEADGVRRRMRGGTRPVGGVDRRGSSSWQSLTRSTGDIEADYLNGEITLLGRLHGVATPVNAYLQELAVSLARERRPPGSVPIEAVVADLVEHLDLSAPPG